MRRWLRAWAALLGLAALAGVLVLVSGIVPIKASSGHWAITSWMLNFAKSRSVATHSIGIQAPDLSDSDLVLKGAGPYHVNCAPCHGSPELRYPVVARQMTPFPPYLPHSVHKWEPQELFYMVKHGIKFTGMPAWPAQDRDDEVWAVVAFLMRLPEMDQAQYRDLVHGPAGDPSPLPGVAGLADPAQVAPSLIQSCVGCHGVEGRGRGANAVPLLAGQRATYLAAALQAYASGDRHSGIMQPVARGLSAAEIRQLAQYYSGFDLLSAAATDRRPESADLSTTTASEPQDPEAAAALMRGEAIAQQGVAADRIPSCVDCHASGRTEDPAAKNPHYPILAGQNAGYMELQLQLFQQRARGGSPYAHLMHPVADALDAQQIRDVAGYFASLDAGQRREP